MHNQSCKGMYVNKSIDVFTIKLYRDHDWQSIKIIHMKESLYKTSQWCSCSEDSEGHSNGDGTQLQC